MDEDEEPLEGGNASSEVVRVGSTVRKPWTAQTASVHEFMTAVRAAGVDVPAPLGRDDRGRQMIEFVPGRLAMREPTMTVRQLARVGALVRAIHDAAGDFTPTERPADDMLLPAPEHELMCHNDLAPWNLIVGDRWVFIDWDGAGPGSRLWDLAYSAQAFTLSDVHEPADHAATRLAAFVDGYRADRGLREQLPTAMAQRTQAMYQLLASSQLSGREPWASMYANGHGEHWSAASGYVALHRDVWARALA